MKMVVSWDMNGNIMRNINYHQKLVCPYCGHPSIEIGLVQQLSLEVGEAS